MRTTHKTDSGRAWLACVLALIALFVAFGLAYSYGVFFPAIMAEFHAGRGQGALFFSITSFVFFSLGCLSGPLCDRVGPRSLLVAGGLLVGSGLWLTAHAETLTGAYVSYGLGVGLGVGCIYVPAVTAVGQWFELRRTLALGIAVTGIGLGTLAFAPMSAWLVAAYGWRSTYALYGGVGAGVIVVCGLLFPRPPRATRTTGNVGRNLIRKRRFVWLYVATLLLNTALYVPFVHLPTAAQAAGVTQLRAAGLIGVLGVASVVGRLVIGMAGDRLQQMTLYRLCFAVISISFVLWALAESYVVFLLFAIVVGAAYGGYIALTPAVLATLFGPQALGRLLGVIYTAVAIGAMLGPLLVGAVAERVDGYTSVLLALTAISLCSLLPLTLVRDDAAVTASTGADM